MELPEIGDAAGVGTRTGAENLNLAGNRWQQADDGFKQGGFTGTVGADEGDGLSGFKLEINIGYYGLSVISDAQMTGGDVNCSRINHVMLPFPAAGGAF